MVLRAKWLTGGYPVMSAKSKGDQGEYEFTRGAYDELREAEITFKVKFATYLDLAPARGVWSLLVVAWEPTEEAYERKLVSYQATWPNSAVISFGAFLYGSCHRAVRLLEAKLAAMEDSRAG